MLVAVIAQAASLESSYVTLTNNTPENLFIKTSLATSDHSFQQANSWGGMEGFLAPYETKQVLWFSRNKDIHADQSYQFKVIATRENQEEPLLFNFDETGKVHGSDLRVSLTFPEKQWMLLDQTGMQIFNEKLWGINQTFYARTWLPSNKQFNQYHFVINQSEGTPFDMLDKQKISILTYNVQLMPFYANVVDDLNQPSVRAKDLPAKIANYDVVILEELFDHDLRDKVKEGMKPYYPYHTKSIDDGSIAKVWTGGVLIFSKWPIINEKQIVYQASAHEDNLAAKGAVYAAINKSGKIYHVIGTHLQAGSDDEEKKAKHKQLEELVNFVDTLNIPKTDPLLLGGDFNINQFGNDIDELLSMLRVRLFDNVGYRYSYDGTINTMAVSKNKSRLDYVFYSNLHAIPLVATNKVFILRDLDNEKMWPKFDMSDHFPTASYFEF